MTINHQHIDFELLRRFAETVRGITNLPGIPTASWGTQAAAAVARLDPDCLTCVRLIEATSGGEFASTLCVGAFDAREHANADPDLLNVEGECLAAWWLLSTARANELNADPMAGALRAAPGCERWEFSNLGRRWSSLGVREVWIGARSFTAPAPSGNSRWAVVELGGRGPEGGNDADLSDSLRAAMPDLAERASLAFGVPGAAEGDATLTHREYEVLTLLARGRTVKQIAESLSRSPHTVHDHVKALHRKLGASSRGELVARALGHIDPQGNVVRTALDAQALPDGAARAHAAAG